MKVLIIGASGFLGGAIATAFLDKSHEVVGVYHSSEKSIPKGCKAININDVKKLEDTFDTVVVAAGNYTFSPKELIDVNVLLCRQVSQQFTTAKLVYISSVNVYGNHSDRIDERSSFNQPSFYGLSKLAGEAVAQTHNRYAIIRLTYLYGPHMPMVSFLPILINKAKTTGKITLFGQGERLQNYLHVQDAAELCVAASRYEENDIFLGATSHSLSNLEVAETIKSYIPNLQIDFEGQDTAPWFQFDNSKSVAKLDWQSRHDFSATIKEIVYDASGSL